MLPNDVWKTLETEEDLLNALNEDESTEPETNETEEEANSPTNPSSDALSITTVGRKIRPADLFSV